MLFTFLVLFSSPAFASEPFAPGNYAKECARFEEDDFLTGSLEIGAEGAWRRTRTAYEEEGCLTPWIEFREEGKIQSVSGEKLDLGMEKVGYRPLTAEVAEALNISEFCGESDWQAHVLKTVSGRQCGDYPVPAVGATVYTQLRLEENSLRLGEEDGSHDGLSPGGRHERFEAGVYRPVPGFSK